MTMPNRKGTVSRRLRRDAIQRIAKMVFKQHGGSVTELATLENVYALLGARDTQLFDLQVLNAGLKQEIEARDMRIRELEAQVSLLKGEDLPTPIEPAAQVLAEIHPNIEVARVATRVAMTTDGDFGGTHVPH